jgi:hypothetical protein
LRIRLYFDEDSMDKALLRALKARGIDAISALDAGKIEISDEEHLLFATAEGRVLCSFNVGDFFRLHTQFLQEGRDRAGSSSLASSSIRWGSTCAASSG